jgi:hypothetical protein
MGNLAVILRWRPFRQERGAGHPFFSWCGEQWIDPASTIGREGVSWKNHTIVSYKYILWVGCIISDCFINIIHTDLVFKWIIRLCHVRWSFVNVRKAFGVSVGGRDCSVYRLDRMNDAAIADPETRSGPVPAIYSLQCILEAPWTVVPCNAFWDLREL